MKTVNAFNEELSFFKQCNEKKVKQNGQILSKGRYNPRFCIKQKPFRCPTVLGDSKKGVISNGDKKVNRTLSSSCLSVRTLWDSFTKYETFTFSLCFVFNVLMTIIEVCLFLSVCCVFDRKSAPQYQPSVKSSPKAVSHFRCIFLIRYVHDQPFILPLYMGRKIDNVREKHAKSVNGL